MQPSGTPIPFVAPGVPHPAFLPSNGATGFTPAGSQPFLGPQGFVPLNSSPSIAQPFSLPTQPIGPYPPGFSGFAGAPQGGAPFPGQFPNPLAPQGPFGAPQNGFGAPQGPFGPQAFQNNFSNGNQMGVPGAFQNGGAATQGGLGPFGAETFGQPSGSKPFVPVAPPEPSAQNQDPELQKFVAEAREKGIVAEADTLLSWSGLDVLVNEKEGFLNLRTKPNPKQILFNTNGYARSGECLAIMGGSGSGKSTLLNILSGRNQTSSDYIVRGNVTINGLPVNYKKYKRVTGFVMQSDIFLENLTVEEYFRFAIDLKQFDKTPKQRKEAVDEMLALLKLEKARSTMVGGKTLKGISGGEKKRLNIGFELLAGPRILYLDEPTSGLDSYTSYIIVDVMRKLARIRNLIVIYTIHQPSVDCFKLFDNLMILNQGKTVFFGSAANSINYYASLDHPVPTTKNPTNHYIEQAMRSSPETLEQFYQGHQTQQIPVIMAESARHSGQEINYKSLDPGFFRQFYVLMWRAIINFFRNKVSFIVRIVQTLFICLLYILLYARIGDLTDSDQTQRELAERTYGGAIFFACINQFIMYFMNVLVVFPQERATFAKEYTSGYYNVSPYYFSKLIVELPIVALFPLIFLAIAYFIIGFVPDAGSFFLFAVGLIILAVWGTLLGILIGCLVHDGSLAVEIAPLIFVPFLLFSGFTQNSDNVPKWLIWVMYLSPMRYMFEWCVRSQFEGINDNYIETLNFNLGYGAIIGISIGYMFALICLSVLVLKWGSKSIKN